MYVLMTPLLCSPHDYSIASACQQLRKTVDMIELVFYNDIQGLAVVEQQSDIPNHNYSSDVLIKVDLT